MNVVMLQALGSISWNLPAAIEYEPAAELLVRVAVANPSLVPHEYCLVLRLTKQGQIVSEATMPVDSEAWFRVLPQQTVALDGTISADVTDAVLNLLLKENETQTYVDSISVELISATINWSEMFHRALPYLLGMAAVGMMVPVIIGAFKEKE